MERISLQEILTKYKTDKNTLHSYGPVYEELFAPLRDTATVIMEIGNSESLLAWREYFPNATIYYLGPYEEDPSDDRITSIKVDPSSLDLLQCAALPRADIIIDDYTHHPQHQAWGVFCMWNCLKPDGLYVIEDIQPMIDMNHFNAFNNPTYYDLRHMKGRPDDTMVVLRKSSLARLATGIGAPLLCSSSYTNLRPLA